MGRAIKPIVNVLKERIRPVNGSARGKNSVGNTSAAAVPYKKKSYHSMVVQIVLATTASINARREVGNFFSIPQLRAQWTRHEQQHNHARLIKSTILMWIGRW